MLAVDGGGEIATDPRYHGPQALQRMFQFDIALDGIGNATHFGQRLFVRFEHHEPLMQWYQRGLLFLSSFNV